MKAKRYHTDQMTQEKTLIVRQHTDNGEGIEMGDLKLYTFTNEYDQIVQQVRAYCHNEAVMMACGNNAFSVDHNTSFYSETIED